MAVAGYVLSTVDHPSADRVLDEVRKVLPEVARATIYNTLNLFVETRSGERHHLEDIGGSVSFATGESMEALLSELHADGELTESALRTVAAKHGLAPTEDGGFAPLEGR